MSDLIPKHGGYRKLKSFQVARSSLEELKLDYEDFLRQRNMPMLEPDHPVLMRFKRQKPQTVKEFAVWVAEERKKCTDAHGLPRTSKDFAGSNPVRVSLSVCESPCQSLPPVCLAANAVLSLLNLSCYLLDRQVQRLANNFENEGGFTERLYRVRSVKRRKKS